MWNSATCVLTRLTDAWSCSLEMKMSPEPCKEGSDSFLASHEPFLLPLSWSVRLQSQVYPQQDAGAARISRNGIRGDGSDHATFLISKARN